MDWIAAVDGLSGLATLIIVFWLAQTVYRQQRGLAEKLFLGMVISASLSAVRHVLESAFRLMEATSLPLAEAGLSDVVHGLWPVDIAALVIFASLALHFTYVFPRLASLLQRWPRFPYVVYAPALALAGMMLTRLWLSDEAYYAFWHLGNLTDDALQLAFTTVILGLSVLRWIYVVLSTHSALVRRQMMGLLGGGAVAALIAIATDYLPDILRLPVSARQVPGLRQLPTLILFSSFVWAIQRHQILDVRRVLSRSLVYTLLSAILALLYLLVMLMAMLLLQQGTTGFGTTIASLLGALVMAIAAIPLRDAVQRLIDRLFYGRIRDYREILREHSRQLTALMSPQQLFEQILDRVETTFHPQGMVIALAEGESFTVRAVKGQMPVQSGTPLTLPAPILHRLRSEGEPLGLEPDEGSLTGIVSRRVELVPHLKGVSLIITFLAQEVLIGWMGLWPRRNEAPYTLRQRNFLATLANQSCVALQNAELYEKMKHKASELAALNAVSTAITSSLEVDEVLQTIASSVLRVIGCQKMAIYVVDEARQTVDLAMGNGLSDVFLCASQAIPLDDGPRTTTIVSEQPLTVPDILDTPGFADLSELMTQEGIRALAEVPLWGKEFAIGSLAVYYTAPHHFTGDEIELLTTLAAQAAIALENARLYVLTDQALTQRVEELSAVEDINRELASTLDFEGVINTVLHRAMSATGAPYGVIGMLDESGMGLRLLTYEGYTPERIEPFRELSWPLTQGIVGRAARLAQPMLVADVTQDPDYDPTMPDVRSHLSVPIVKAGRVLGMLALESPIPGAFDASHIRFVSQWIEHAATAIENAHLYMKAQQRISQLSNLQQFGLQVVSSLHLQAVLDAVAESALNLVKANDVHIFLYDEENDELTFRAGLWASGERAKGVPSVRRDGLTFTVAHSGEPLVINDALTHPLFSSPERRRWGARAIAGFPLKHAGQVLGVFNIAFTVPHAFTEDELRVLTLLGNQAAIAIANARLFQQVAEGRDRMAAILNSVREGILMLDLQDRILMANPMAEELLETPHAQLIGRTLPEVMQGYQAQKERLLHSQEAWQLPTISEHDGVEPHGAVRDTVELASPHRRILERAVAPVGDGIGTLLGHVVILRDVTEEKELERMRDDLNDMIVHDLRAPLSSVISGSMLLQEVLIEQKSEDEVTSLLRIITTSSQRMLDLVSSLLDISRIEAGKLTLNAEPFNLLSTVQEVVTRLQPLQLSRGVHIDINIPPDFPATWGDREKIARVFTNLLDNAIKFTPTGGQVQISAQVDEPGINLDSEWAICSVLDTGTGIPPEHRDRIFEKFTQLSLPPDQGRPVERIRGSGIGLNFCKLTIEAHGGRIWVEAGPNDQGSLFKFTLPLADDITPSAEAERIMT